MAIAIDSIMVMFMVWFGVKALRHYEELDSAILGAALLAVAVATIWQIIKNIDLYRCHCDECVTQDD